MDPNQIKSTIYHINIPSLIEDSSLAFYSNLYKEIAKYITPSNTKPPNITRVTVLSLGSPLTAANTTENGDLRLLQFFHALRGLLRSSLAVCMITFPAYFYSNSFIRKVEHLADVVVAFESFAAQEETVSAHFKEYSGLVHIKKLLSVNTLAYSIPDTADIAYKIRSKKLKIEKFHLPPDIGDAAPSSSSIRTVPQQSATVNCATSTINNKWDF